MDELAHIREIEKKWQRIWKENRVFEANPDTSKPKFFITVPYPYTSGPLHIGHGRTYTIGDVIARYKRLKGYNVLFPMAFHITGTPIASISDRIRDGEAKSIAQYREYVFGYEKDWKKVDEIVKSFVDPYKVAEYFASKIQIDFEALGFSIDWRRKFHTGEKVYNRFVEWQYYKLRDGGYITRGSHQVTYCLYHQQPEGEDDIKDADVNPVEILEFVAIKFDYGDGKIIAGTLRPETIFGATNLWVNPDAKYVKVEWNGEILYMSKEAAEKFSYQRDGVKILSEIDGKEFVGKKAVSPLGNELLILPAQFVDPDQATGFVYSEPSDAPYDYVALQELKSKADELKRFGIDPEDVKRIEPIKIIDVPGIGDHHAKVVVEKMGIKSQLEREKLDEATKRVYKEQYYEGVLNEKTGKFKGLKVSEAKEKVKNWLISEGKALIFYETSRKAQCRAGGKIIVATIRDQWFLDYSRSDWKEKTRKWLDEMFIYPTKYKKLFYDTVDWLYRRPCARKRGLGTKLPFDPEWIIESLSDSTIYMAFYTIIHKIREYGIKPEQLVPEFFDYVFLGIGEIERVSDLTGIPKDILEEMRKEFTYWYPNDLRHTSIPHITNHLTFFIMHHIAIFPEKYWPRAITLNEPVIKEGEKISKSKGNVVLLREIAERYSADLFRLYSVFAADLDGILDWRERDVSDLKKQFIRFYNMITRIAKMPKVGLDELKSIPERWFVSKFYKRLKRADELMENFKFRDAVVELFFNIQNDISYLEKRIGKDKVEKVLRAILEDWIIALSPIIPHICEEVWSIMGNKGFVSLAKWPDIESKPIDELSEFKEEFIRRTISDIDEILKIVKVEPKKIKFVVASNWKRKLFEEILKLFDRNITKMGDMMREIMKFEEFKKRSKEVSNILKKVIKDRKVLPEKILSADEEYKILEEAKDFIKTSFGCEIDIEREEDIVDPKELGKAKQALPMKPGIIIY